MQNVSCNAAGGFLVASEVVDPRPPPSPLGTHILAPRTTLSLRSSATSNPPAQGEHSDTHPGLRYVLRPERSRDARGRCVRLGYHCAPAPRQRAARSVFSTRGDWRQLFTINHIEPYAHVQAVGLRREGQGAVVESMLGRVSTLANKGALVRNKALALM